MDNLIPNSGAFFTENNYENEISNYVSQQFFRCVRPFLSWMKKGETYWFEYHNDGEYEVRSDNNLGQKFEMTTHQLLGNFYSVECETDICDAMDYAYWLGDGQHTNSIESCWAFLKRSVYGIFHHVSVKYLQQYVDEFCFRLNHRDCNDAFNKCVELAVA